MKYLLSLLIITVFISCQNQSTMVAESTAPNIVWLVAEDQSPDWFPMYGDSIQSLPYLQSLSADGVVFTNAVSPVAVCAPARSAIITGMYPSTLGTHNMRTYNAYANGENEPSINIPSYSPIVPDGVKMFTEYLRKKGYYTSNGPKEDYNFEKTDAAWDDSSNDHNWRNRSVNQPFFSVFNFSVCHESQVWARSRDSLFVHSADIKVPPYFPDTPTVRHDLAVNYSNLKRLDNQIGKIIEQLKYDGLYNDTYIFFYGDHGGPFPRYKRALYDTGIKVPMVIKFPKNKNAGSTDDRLFNFIDLAPTVLSLAGIEPPKVMQGIAQFGEFENKKKPQISYHTSDRFDELYDRLRAVRTTRFKYIRNYNTDISRALPVAYRKQMGMMQELRQLDSLNQLDEFSSIWIQPTKPEEEFYDLVNDPEELHNLALNTLYKDSLNHFRELLEKLIKDTKDLGEINERTLIDNWLVHGKQPKLENLEVTKTKKGLELIHPNPNTTIVWRILNDSIWNIYSEILPINSHFEAKAERIGYQDSEVLVWD
ncbi:sulfatase family protein [Maribacter hydrothermalis]|uniref:Sulfatase n=1 Tax=Maribacter hydrothermalis TaxID=1836467 RepID=A0A1B7Z0L9_9FLAO|nr:sulfatase [Maribacter hydrothermalis]APQ16222.1 sulfatase [Maribacter hydrothermalis]OBR36090.1 sulfatase [Maribacter hydrothermalis]